MSTRKLYSPLRYPGGKGKLARYIKAVFERNDLLDGHYVEPYAGGASLAIELLCTGYAMQVHINDVDPGVYAFWRAVLEHPEEICRFIRDTPVTLREWKRQRDIQRALRAQPFSLDLAFSTFFLNRTNRSGIINGGVIGGLKQDAKDKVDARFNRADLISRVQKIARLSSRIHLTCMDACELLAGLCPKLPARALVYLDPPYFVKGGDLYRNYYRFDDHAKVAGIVRHLTVPWLVSYDDVPEIRKLYEGFRSRAYGLHYSAAGAATGAERMFFSGFLKPPYGIGRYLAAA
jgi:DNA adenine methylase